MKVAGIIAEYNPFHNGHAYHIEEVRKRTGADYVVVVMSGNFVQRGAPAIVGKYTRTKMALLGGADLVIELPVIAATASAETFARTGVAILDSLGCVTHLGFGCETDNLELLDCLATLFSEEPEVYKDLLSSYLKDGQSYPVARARAAKECLELNHNKAALDIILSTPNNILAIEYLKAIKQLDSTMKPCPILRQGSGYHDKTISGMFPSATAIRTKLKASDIYDLNCQIPELSAQVLTEELQKSKPIMEDDFSGLLHYKLCLEQENFCNYVDVKEDLSNRILNMKEHFTSFSRFIEDVKTKNMTYTGISRGLLHIMLNMKQSDISLLAKTNYAPYIRLLGFRKTAAPLLAELKQASKTVISQLAKDQQTLSDEEKCLLQLDIASADIYNVIRKEKTESCNIKNEYRTPLVIV